MPFSKMIRVALASAVVLGAGAIATAPMAEEIVVSNYRVTVNGMPYAIAMAKGYFQEEGADVTGILSSSGGGTTIRNLMGGNLAYAESSLPSIVSAEQQGAPLKIISAMRTRWPNSSGL